MNSGILLRTGAAGAAAGLLVTAATATAATLGPAVATSHAMNFQNQSETVFCGITAYVHGTIQDPGVQAPLNGNYPGLQCSARGITKKKSNDGDPFVQLGQGRAGRAKLVFIGDDDLTSQSAPATIKPGGSWSKDNISCTVTRTSVTCHNSSGHGFTIAKGSLKLH